MVVFGMFMLKKQFGARWAKGITFNGAQPPGPSKEEIHDGGGFVKLELHSWMRLDGGGWRHIGDQDLILSTVRISLSLPAHYLELERDTCIYYLHL